MCRLSPLVFGDASHIFGCTASLELSSLVVAARVWILFLLSCAAILLRVTGFWKKRRLGSPQAVALLSNSCVTAATLSRAAKAHCFPQPLSRPQMQGR